MNTEIRYINLLQERIQEFLDNDSDLNDDLIDSLSFQVDDWLDLMRQVREPVKPPKQHIFIMRSGDV